MISGATPPDYSHVYAKMEIDAATKAIEANLGKINDAIKNAGDPDYDPTDPFQN